jgi:hypothetical protein
MRTAIGMHRIDEWEIRDAQARPIEMREGCALRVRSGRIWLTLERGVEDIWLLPGDEWFAPQAVRVWLSAEPTATLQHLMPVRAGRPAQTYAMRPSPMRHSLRKLLRWG